MPKDKITLWTLCYNRNNNQFRYISSKIPWKQTGDWLVKQVIRKKLWLVSKSLDILEARADQ